MLYVLEVWVDHAIGVKKLGSMKKIKMEPISIEKAREIKREMKKDGVSINIIKVR